LLLGWEILNAAAIRAEISTIRKEKGLTGATLTTDPDPQKTKLSTKSAIFGRPMLLEAAPH